MHWVDCQISCYIITEEIFSEIITQGTSPSVACLRTRCTLKGELTCSRCVCICVLYRDGTCRKFQLKGWRSPVSNPQPMITKQVL